MTTKHPGQQGGTTTGGGNGGGLAAFANGEYDRLYNRNTIDNPDQILRALERFALLPDTKRRPIAFSALDNYGRRVQGEGFFVEYAPLFAGDTQIGERAIFQSPRWQAGVKPRYFIDGKEEPMTEAGVAIPVETYYSTEELTHLAGGNFTNGRIFELRIHLPSVQQRDPGGQGQQQTTPSGGGGARA